MYGAEATGIDLVNGKYGEQIQILKELNEEKFKELENSQQAALTAAENSISEYKHKEYASDVIKSNEKNRAAIDELNTIISDRWNKTMENPISFQYGLFGNIKGISVQQDEQGLESLSEAMDTLKDKGYANSEAFVLLNSAYKELSETLNGVRQAADDLAKTKLQSYIQTENNAIENLTSKSFPE